MKSYTLITISIIMLLLAFGCEEEFLDKQPQGKVFADEFYTNLNNMEQALNACYDPMQHHGHFGSYLLIGMDIMTNDSEKGGESASDGPEYLELDLLTFNANNRAVYEVWRTSYHAIKNTNVFINKMELFLDDAEGSGEYTEEDLDLAKRYLGEAHFLRGMYYYYLTALFGPVPLVEKDITPNEIPNYSRPTVEEAWSFIKDDLTYAIGWQEEFSGLPVKSEYEIGDLGRATKGAAMAYLTKVYMHQEMWENALALVDSIVQSGEYSLYANSFGDWSHYGDIFILEGEHGPGSIFEVNAAIDGPEEAPNGNPNEGIMYNVRNSPRKYFDKDGNSHDFSFGWGFNTPTQEFYDAFIDDPRLPLSVYSEGFLIDQPVIDTLQSLDFFNAANLSSLLDQKFNNFEQFADAVDEAMGSPLSSAEFDILLTFARENDSIYTFHPQDPDQGSAGWYQIDFSASTTGKYMKKTYIPFEQTPAGLPQKYKHKDGQLNIKVIRYADILLLGAEAAAHLGQDAKAQNLVNTVRRRAYTGDPGSEDFPKVTTFGQALLDDIDQERRIELGFEGHRWIDLVRTGRAAEVIGEKFITGKHERWPIPAADVTTSGGTIEQNPNW